MLKCSNFVVIKQIALMNVRIQVCQSTQKIFVEYALQRHRQPSRLHRKARRTIYMKIRFPSKQVLPVSHK